MTPGVDFFHVGLCALVAWVSPRSWIDDRSLQSSVAGGRPNGSSFANLTVRAVLSGSPSYQPMYRRPITRERRRSACTGRAPTIEAVLLAVVAFLGSVDDPIATVRSQLALRGAATARAVIGAVVASLACPQRGRNRQPAFGHCTRGRRRPTGVAADRGCVVFVQLARVCYEGRRRQAWPSLPNTAAARAAFGIMRGFVQRPLCV